jgi:hypothetical protein
MEQIIEPAFLEWSSNCQNEAPQPELVTTTGLPADKCWETQEMEVKEELKTNISTFSWFKLEGEEVEQEGTSALRRSNNVELPRMMVLQGLVERDSIVSLTPSRRSRVKRWKSSQRRDLAPQKLNKPLPALPCLGQKPLPLLSPLKGSQRERIEEWLQGVVPFEWELVSDLMRRQ